MPGWGRTDLLNYWNAAAAAITPGQTVLCPVVSGSPFEQTSDPMSKKVKGFVPVYIDKVVVGQGDHNGKTPSYIQGHFVADHMTAGANLGGPNYGALTSPKLVF
jgi:hypothetical protein